MNAKALPANPEFRYQFDPCVFQDYAARLLPRAVGYSAGLLEYFFRGRIEIAVPDRYVYGRAAFTADNSGSFTSLRFEVPNATPNEAAGAGTLRAVVRYRTAEENLFEDPLAPVSATPAVARSTVQEVTLTDAFQELPSTSRRSSSRQMRWGGATADPVTWDTSPPFHRHMLCRI